MGGRNSGRRWHYGAKDSTDDYRAIDVRRWQQESLLTPGNSFSWKWTHGRTGELLASVNVRTETDMVILSYRSRSGDDEWKNQEYPIWLDRTPCNFGGERVWFQCPAKGCGRRMAILYGGAIFACRIVTNWPIQASGKTPLVVKYAKPIKYGIGWAGNLVSATVMGESQKGCAGEPLSG